VTAQSAGRPEPSRPGSPRQVWSALVFVILVFVALASVIAIRTPAWESADEPDHVYNIEQIVSGHWYGINTHCGFLSTSTTPSCVPRETQQAPLYYLVMAAWQKMVGLSPRSTTGELGDAGNCATVSCSYEHFSHHSVSDHQFLLWLRFPNIALGALTVLVVFLAIRRVSRDPWTPVVAAAILAFLPRFVFLSAFVTNDNLVNLLGAVLGYLALRFVTSPSVWNMVWVGVAVGLLVATKLSALPMALVVVILVLLVPTWKRRLILLAAASGGAVLTCGWYLIQNAVRYGDPFARAASSRYLEFNGGLGTFFQPYRVTDPLSLVFRQVPQTFMRTFWYESGWNQYTWKMPVDIAITAAVLIVLFGLLGQKISRDVLITLATISVAAVLSVWIVATQTAEYQGRYALVGCVGIAGLVAFALQRWKLPVRLLPPAAGVIGTCIAIQANVLSIHWT
jgi:Dolichyl-phosphate-mannose-protein mannosyltransferase